MSEFLTNEQIKEFVEAGGIMKCMELIEKDYAKPQSMSPKYFFPILEEMGYEKVVHCKDCIHRPERNYRYKFFFAEGPTIGDREEDTTCPYVCDDPYHTTIPEDDFYCKYGEKNNV